MYLNDLYVEYQLAYQFFQQGFELISINEEADEVWFEKVQNNTSTVVRFLPKGFNWQNHLKNDVTTTYQRIHQMRKTFRGKHIKAITIYSSEQAPVDDWETLKKPITSNTKNPITMQLYYLHEQERSAELGRLQNDTGLDLSLDDLEGMEEEEKERKISFYKQSLFHDFTNRVEKKRRVFSYGKPLFTYLLIAINVYFFFQQVNNGGSEDIETLIEMGAKYNPLIMEGEWWRLVTSMFLHIGVFHLIMNMIALFYLGTAIERIFGRTRFILIYFLGGILGSLASFASSISISAGASGAIFGLFGALLFFGLIYKDVFKETIGMNIAIILIINLVLGFTIPEIDMGAHLGGLVGGFLAAVLVYVPKKTNKKYQLGALLAFIVLSVGLVFYGIEQNSSSLEFTLIEVEERLSNNEFEEVIELSTEALDEQEIDYDNELQTYFLFHRSYAYIQLDEPELAQEDLEDSILYENVIPESYYNLAIIYAGNFEFNEAKDIVDKGLERFPDEQDLIDLQDELSYY